MLTLVVPQPQLSHGCQCTELAWLSEIASNKGCAVLQADESVQGNLKGSSLPNSLTGLKAMLTQPSEQAEAAALLRGLLQIEPHKRTTAQQALAYPFLQS